MGLGFRLRVRVKVGRDYHGRGTGNLRLSSYSTACIA
jgi:hypothetical protein